MSAGTGPHHQPAFLVDRGCRRLQRRDVVGQMDHDLAADGGAGGAVAPAHHVPATVDTVQGQEGLHQQLTAVDRSGRAAALRCVTGIPSGAQSTLTPAPTTRRPIGGRLGQDAGELEVADHQVVRPLELDVNPGRGHRPLDQRQGHGGDGEVAAGGGKFSLAGAEQDREEQRLPGRRLPPPVETAPSGGLVVSYDNEARRGAGPRPFEQD